MAELRNGFQTRSTSSCLYLYLVHVLIHLIWIASALATLPNSEDMCTSWDNDVLCSRFDFCAKPWQPTEPHDPKYMCQKGASSSTVTMVVALYDIKREGRPILDYVTWLRKTININAYIILYTNQEVYNGLMSRHGPHGFTAEGGKLCFAIADTYPLEPIIPFVQILMGRMKGAPWLRATNDLVYKNPGYSPVIHSKFAFMLHAMDWNPFNSTHFYWFDAGISRFFQPEVNFKAPINKTRALLDHVLVEQTQALPNISDKTAGFTSIIGTCTGAIIAGTWGGPVERLRAMSRWMLCHYFDMLSHEKMDTEQPGMLLYYLRKKSNLKTACSKDSGLECDIKMQFQNPAMMNYLWSSD